MKIKTLFVAGCMALSTTLWAASEKADTAVSHHFHPQASQELKVNKKAMYPGYCEIEIINNSYDNVTVFGRFDDGTELQPFNVYSYEYPHYIHLDYYGYCHAGMDLFIRTFSGYQIYAGYTPVYSTVRIVPYLNKQLKAEVVSKPPVS